MIAWDRDSAQAPLAFTRRTRHLHDTPAHYRHTVTVCPGFFGGVETPMAYTNGRLFVPIVNLCAHGSATGYQAIETLNPIRGTGEVDALDATTGHIIWKRTPSRSPTSAAPQPPTASSSPPPSTDISTDSTRKPDEHFGRPARPQGSTAARHSRATCSSYPPAAQLPRCPTPTTNSSPTHSAEQPG